MARVFQFLYAIKQNQLEMGIYRPKSKLVEKKLMQKVFTLRMPTDFSAGKITIETLCETNKNLSFLKANIQNNTKCSASSFLILN